MSKCPIGLLCELMECRPRVCSEYARPWYIPYSMTNFNPLTNKFENYLHVTLWRCTYDAPNVEHEIIAEQEENSWIITVNLHAWLAGWANPVELPYEFKDSALFVTNDLHIDENVAWLHSIDMCQGSSDWFLRAIPLKEIKQQWSANYLAGLHRKLDEYGFWEWDLLFYRHAFCDGEM